MKREEAIRVLKGHAEDLLSMGVASLSLFGSTARDQAGEQSDVDLLVEFSRPVTLFEFFRLQHRLEAILQVPKVDLIQRGAEHPALRDRIRAESIEAVHAG